MQTSNVTIHSLKDCYYCEKAKDYLTDMGKEYSVVNYEKDSADYKEKVDKLIATTSYTKFPQIFIDGEFIGGYQELRSVYEF